MAVFMHRNDIQYINTGYEYYQYISHVETCTYIGRYMIT